MFIRGFAEFNATLIKSIISTLATAIALRDTILSTVFVPNVNLARLITNSLRPAALLPARESTNFSQQPPILAYAQPKLLESKEFARIAILDSIMTATATDASANLAILKRMDIAFLPVLLTQLTLMEDVFAPTDCPSTMVSA